MKSELFEDKVTRCVEAVASPLGRATASSTESVGREESELFKRDENDVFYVTTYYYYFISI